MSQAQEISLQDFDQTDQPDQPWMSLPRILETLEANWQCSKSNLWDYTEWIAETK